MQAHSLFLIYLITYVFLVALDVTQRKYTIINTQVDRICILFIFCIRWFKVEETYFFLLLFNHTSKHHNITLHVIFRYTRNDFYIWCMQNRVLDICFSERKHWSNRYMFLFLTVKIHYSYKIQNLFDQFNHFLFHFQFSNLIKREIKTNKNFSKVMRLKSILSIKIPQ